MDFYQKFIHVRGLRSRCVPHIENFENCLLAKDEEKKSGGTPCQNFLNNYYVCYTDGKHGRSIGESPELAHPDFRNYLECALKLENEDKAKNCRKNLDKGIFKII